MINNSGDNTDDDTDDIYNDIDDDTDNDTEYVTVDHFDNNMTLSVILFHPPTPTLHTHTQIVIHPNNYLDYVTS